MNTPDQLPHREVVETFELDGVPAQVVRMAPEDLKPEDIANLVEHLTDTNFQILPIPNADKRMEVRDMVVRMREAVDRIPVVGKSIAKSNVWDTVHDEIYPDGTRGEHVRAYRKRYQQLAKDKRLMGVQVNGHMVALQGFAQTGVSESGRPVFEFTKASTSELFEKKGLNSRLKRIIFQEIMREHPDGMWATASRNADHIKRFQERGWHIAEMNDPNEAVQVMFQKNPTYHTHMISQGYKAIYCDPKVDTITWGKSE
ncbi:MAG: hypothetical protein WC101_04275 [Candidatus Gracilibacteria bacterium]